MSASPIYDRAKAPGPVAPPRPERTTAEIVARYARTHADEIARLEQSRLDATERINARDPQHQADLATGMTGPTTYLDRNGDQQWADPERKVQAR